jgi:polar amino acid transport system substrate-binding protein
MKERPRRARGVAALAALATTIALYGCSAWSDRDSTAARAPATASPVLERIQQRGELLLGTSGNQPPLNATTKDGRIVGLEIDLARAMASAMDVKLRVITMPFSELLSAVQSGKVDVVLSGMTMTPQRNMKVAFVGPYFVSGKSLLSKLETMSSVSDTSEINSPSMRLAALEGSTSQYFVERIIPKASLTLTQDYDEAVGLVREGKIDALIADYPFCAISVFRYPEDHLVTLKTPFTFEPLGIALPAGDPLMVNWVENFLTMLEGTGVLFEITTKWFEDGSWVSQLR